MKEGEEKKVKDSLSSLHHVLSSSCLSLPKQWWPSGLLKCTSWPVQVVGNSFQKSLFLVVLSLFVACFSSYILTLSFFLSSSSLHSSWFCLFSPPPPSLVLVLLHILLSCYFSLVLFIFISRKVAEPPAAQLLFCIFSWDTSFAGEKASRKTTRQEGESKKCEGDHSFWETWGQWYEQVRQQIHTEMKSLKKNTVGGGEQVPGVNSAGNQTETSKSVSHDLQREISRKKFVSTWALVFLFFKASQVTKKRKNRRRWHAIMWRLISFLVRKKWMTSWGWNYPFIS